VQASVDRGRAVWTPGCRLRNMSMAHHEGQHACGDLAISATVDTKATRSF
jgi:hypothetical protein